MKTHSKYQSRIGQWLILLLFLCSGFIRAEGDSTKTKFDINDPRNPNCPCHKYQKLADEEYKKFQKKNKGIDRGISTGEPVAGGRLKPGEIDGPHDKVNGGWKGDKLNKKHGGPRIKHKHRKRGKGFSDLKLIRKLESWDLWKRLKDPTACFSWS